MTGSDHERYTLARRVLLDALGYLRELFGTGQARGSQLAGVAVVPLDDPVTIAESVAALAQDLLALL